MFQRCMNKKEQVTSDTIPDVLGSIDPQELRLRKDKLLQRRLKQNPELKSKFQIGEQMITTATFTSDSAFAIDKQYSLLKMMGSEIASNWEFSDISSSSNEDGSEGGSESFTITSVVRDNKLTNDYLNHYLMSGVKLDIVQNNDKELEKENVVNSILEMGIDPAKMASLLLGESKFQLKESIGDLYYEFPIMPNYISKVKEELDAAIEINVPFKYKFLKSNNETFVRVQIVKNNEPDDIYKMNAGILVQALSVAIKDFPKNSIPSSKAIDLLEPYKINSMNEQEEPDSKDAESDVIDDVQSMLVKMLPMTKGLDLSPEKEEELKKHIDAALAIFNSDKQESFKVEPKLVDVNPKDLKVGDTIILNGDTYTVGKDTVKPAMAGGYSLVNGERTKIVQKVLYPKFYKGKVVGWQEAVDYPQFQFAVLVAREEYADAIRILNDANITPKTSFNSDDSSVIAFDAVQSDDAGIPKLSEEQVIKILSDSGIAATSASGLDFMGMDSDQESDELDGSDELDPEDLIARTEAILFGKKITKEASGRLMYRVPGNSLEKIRKEVEKTQGKVRLEKDKLRRTDDEFSTSNEWWLTLVGDLDLIRQIITPILGKNAQAH